RLVTLATPPPTPSPRLPLPPPTNSAHMITIYDWSTNPANGSTRDRVLMLLAIQTGLRVSELTSLNCGDVTLGTSASVRCEGKGRKQRAVPLTNPLETLLQPWLTERAGHPADPLFPTRTGRRLSRDAIALRVSTHTATAAQQCPSLQGKRIHPHVLRHSCAMSLLQA